MDFYVNEFMKTNGIVVDKPFKVENVNRPLIVNTDGTMLYQDTEEVVPIGVLFSVLSGAYKVEKDTDDVVYRNKDTYYYINERGAVCLTLWVGTAADYALLYMGNNFKTYEEAKSKVDYMLDMFKDINKKTSILPNSMGAIREDTTNNKGTDVKDVVKSATISLEKDNGGTYHGYMSYTDIDSGKVITKELVDTHTSLSDILKKALRDVYSK